MSDPTYAVESTPARAPEKTSFWEDVIDIFYIPQRVFQRRAQNGFWPAFLFVVFAMALLSYFLFPAMEPAIEAEMRRNLAASMAKNPQMTQEMADKMINMQTSVGRYAAGVGIAIAILIVGLGTWLVSKMFGAAESFGQAMTITAYAYFPRILGSIVGGVIALTSDPSRLTGIASLSPGPAMLMDPDKSNPLLLALATRFDVFILWETALLAIGIAVLGKITRGKAIAFGATIWLVGGLWALRTAYLMM